MAPRSSGAPLGLQESPPVSRGVSAVLSGRLAQAQDWPAVTAECGVSEKEPAIGDGCQSREEPQHNSIRSNVVCRNSHTHRKTLRTAVRTRKGAGSGPRQYPLNLYRRPLTYSLKRAVPTSASPLESPASPRRGFRFCRPQLSPQHLTSGREPPARPRQCDQISTPADNQLYPYSEHSCALRHSHDFEKLFGD